MSTTLSILALIFSLIGTVATATTLLPREWLLHPEIETARRELLASTRDARKLGYTSPPYPLSVVEEKIAEADRLYAEESAALSKEIARAGYRDEWRRQTWTLWGLLAIALSTVLQAITTFLD
jgi:hypothetical protein